MTSNWSASSFPPGPPPPPLPLPVGEGPEPELLPAFEKGSVVEPLLLVPVGVEAEWKYWLPPLDPFEDEGPLLNAKEAVRVL